MPFPLVLMDACSSSFIDFSNSALLWRMWSRIGDRAFGVTPALPALRNNMQVSRCSF